MKNQGSHGAQGAVFEQVLHKNHAPIPAAERAKRRFGIKNFALLSMTYIGI
jgi:hypothetical protein